MDNGEDDQSVAEELHCQISADFAKLVLDQVAKSTQLSLLYIVTDTVRKIAISVGLEPEQLRLETEASDVIDDLDDSDQEIIEDDSIDQAASPVPKAKESTPSTPKTKSNADSILGGKKLQSLKSVGKQRPVKKKHDSPSKPGSATPRVASQLEVFALDSTMTAKQWGQKYEDFEEALRDLVVDIKTNRQQEQKRLTDTQFKNFVTLFCVELTGRNALARLKKICATCTRDSDGRMSGLGIQRASNMAASSVSEAERKFLDTTARWMEGDEPQSEFHEFKMIATLVELYEEYHNVLADLQRGEAVGLSERMASMNLMRGKGVGLATLLKSYYCSRELLDMDAEQWDKNMKKAQLYYTMSLMFGSGVLLFLTGKAGKRLSRLPVTALRQVIELFIEHAAVFVDICHHAQKHISTPLENGQTQLIQRVAKSINPTTQTSFMDAVAFDLAESDDTEMTG